MTTIRRHAGLITFLFAIAVATQMFLIWMEQQHSRQQFYAAVRHSFVLGVVATMVYKQFITIMMALTTNKTGLDRAFVWSQQSITLLFGYSLYTIEWQSSNQVLNGWIWLNIWVNVMVSSGFVVYYLYRDRIEPLVIYVRWNGWPGRTMFWKLIRGEGRYE
jgi:hypothetical protein